MRKFQAAAMAIFGIALFTLSCATAHWGLIAGAILSFILSAGYEHLRTEESGGYRVRT